MKVIYLHQYFNTPEMSGGIRSYEFARRLVNDGHEVHMITTVRKGSQFRGWKVSNENGIQVHWLYVPYSNKIGFLKRILAFLKFAIFSTTKVLKIKGDVVFATSTPLTIVIPALVGLRLCKIPYVLEVRDVWPEAAIAAGVLKSKLLIYLANKLEKAAYFNSSHIIVLAERFIKSINRFSHNRPITLIPNGCDLDLFKIDRSDSLKVKSSLEWLGEKKLVLYAGTIGKANNISYMVCLAKEVYKVDPEIRFLIIGDGNEKDKVISLAHKVGVLNKNLFYLPPVSKSKIPCYFSISTVSCSFMMNSSKLSADSANKVFDAFAAGKPVILNNIHGTLAPYVTKENLGIVLSFKDIPEAANDLCNFLNDNKKIEEYSKNVISVAESKFSRDILYLKLLDTLKNSIDRP